MKTWKYTLSSDTIVFAMFVMVTILQTHETLHGLQSVYSSFVEHNMKVSYVVDYFFNLISFNI